MKSIGIVGSGIAGLGLAYQLRDRYDITIFEGNSYVGGHTNTIDVDKPSSVAFDTGFMVFNHVTYPLLTSLFQELNVETCKTDMSFSVQHKGDRLEWNGAGLDAIFAERRNLLNLRFWRMLLKLDWFNKNAPEHLQDPQLSSLSISDYVARYQLGADFLNWYLVPMGASVWSTPLEGMLEFPASTLLRFFHNHGFLGLTTHFQWYTVVGGARNYVKALLTSLKPQDRVLTNSAVVGVERTAEGARVFTADGKSHYFDCVALATHADQSLQLLKNPTSLERELLAPFHYQDNTVTVHCDTSVMPTCRKAWASWNHRVSPGEGGATTHYWMNNLQGLAGPTNYFVSLNSEHLVDESKIFRRLNYTHPLFTLATQKAQLRLPELNEQDGSIFYCGSYFRYGFHEDAYLSACLLADRLKALGVACAQ